MGDQATLSDVDGGPSVESKSLWHYFQDVKEHDPESLALIVEHQAPSRLNEMLGLPTEQNDSGQSGLNCTYKQLYTASLRLASGLIHQGVKPGTSIAAFIPSGIEWIMLYWASIMTKTTLSMLDPDALLPSRTEQLQASLEITKPKVILVDNQQEANIIDEVTSKAGVELLVGIVLQTSITTNKTKWQPLAETTTIGGANSVEAKLLQEALEDKDDRLAWIFFTSGTSAGMPKAVPRTVKSVAQGTAVHPKLPSTNRQGRTQRWSISTTNYRVAAAMALFNMFRTGYTMVMASAAFDAGAILHAIHKYQIDGVIFLPSNIYQFMKHPDYTVDCVKPVVSIAMGGDIITKTHLELAKRVFPNYMVTLIYYGMTEGSGWISFPFPPITPIGQIPFWDGTCPAGRVQRGARVRIVDPETMVVVPRGQTGELIVHSNSIIPKYLGHNDTANAEAFHVDKDSLRWFRTGDRAIMAADGLVYVTGRFSNIFKRASIPINPLALENSIASFLGGEQLVCVVPLPSHELGHVPVAIVSSLDEQSKDNVVAHIGSVFGSAYELHDVVELKDLGLNDWPLNSSGKLMRTDITELLLKRK